MLATIRNNQDIFLLKGKSQANSCALSTPKKKGKTEKHYCVVLAHHGKTDLHQLQAKHCLVSTVIAKMALFGEKCHAAAKKLTNTLS